MVAVQMANPTLLMMRLEGPMQSWGTRARWDVRDSADEPTKSGLIGLLGCALGYPVGDPRLEVMDHQIALGVRSEHLGRRLVDFHTISGALLQADGKSKGSTDVPATIVSVRTYLQDAAFLAVLSGPEDLLTRCAASLNAPHWPVYLGRRSCPPARPVFDGVTREYTSCEEALYRHPWDWEGRASLDGFPEWLRCTLEDPHGEAVRRDRVVTNPGRMYGARRVRVFQVPFPGAKEECACTSQD
jgi:CRISPR system Cascade subunit CasD